MDKLNFQWRKKTLTYQTGEELYLGNIRVGEYFWEVTMSGKWAGVVYLPSIKTNHIFSLSEKGIKEKIEQRVQDWFTEALSEKSDASN